VRAVVNQQPAVAERYQATELATSSSRYEFDVLDGSVACLTAPHLFFAEHPREIEQAKSLCRECPVREACLASALKQREPWGVWGGELLLNGRIIADKRARGRPPKVRAA
jgi:WhiB family transcriptional regulator, redox-sensing transcriptional regulator